MLLQDLLAALVVLEDFLQVTELKIVFCSSHLPQILVVSMLQSGQCDGKKVASCGTLPGHLCGKAWSDATGSRLGT